MIATLQHGQKQFKKKGISPMKASRSHTETSILIRKAKKDDERKRRRGITEPDDGELLIKNNTTDTTVDTTLSDDCDTIYHSNCMSVGGKKVRLNTIDETVNMVMTRLRDATIQHLNTHAPGSIKNIDMLDIVRDIRRLLTKPKDQPIGKLLAHGLIPYLVAVIRNHNDPNILYETIWCFINVSTSNVSSHVEAVATSGVVIDITNLLVHENEGVREQALWFTANIAGDNALYRDTIMGLPNVIDGLLYNITYPANISILSTCAWALSNIFRGQSSEILPMAVRFVPDLVSKASVGVKGRVPAAELVDLMTALFHISEWGQEGCDLVLANGVLPVFIDALKYYSDLPNTTMLLMTIVRILWQFSSNSEQQVEQVIHCGFLDCALKLLQLSKKHLQRVVLLTLSNIAAGTYDQINKLLGQRPIMKEIVYLADSGHAEVKKEALWTLSNIITQGSGKQKVISVNLGCIAAFCNFLATPYDNRLVLVVLEAVEKLLMLNKETELRFVQEFECCNGVETIEDLQSSENNEIYEAAARIIVNYFDGVKDDEDENMEPILSEEKTTFEFGFSALPAKQLFPENIANDMDSVLVQLHKFGGNVQMN